MKNLMKSVSCENIAKFIWQERLDEEDDDEKILTSEDDYKQDLAEAVEEEKNYFKEIEPLIDELGEEYIDLFEDTPSLKRLGEKAYDKIIAYLKMHSTAKDMEAIATHWKEDKDIDKNKDVREKNVTGESLIEAFKKYLRDSIDEGEDENGDLGALQDAFEILENAVDEQMKILTSEDDYKQDLAEAVEEERNYFKEIEPLIDELGEEYIDLFEDTPSLKRLGEKAYDKIIAYLKMHSTAKDMEAIATHWKEDKDIDKNKDVREKNVTGESLIEAFKKYLRDSIDEGEDENGDLGALQDAFLVLEEAIDEQVEKQ